MGQGMRYITVSSIAIDPRDPSTIYAGSYYLGGVYRTVDGGASWERVDAGLMNKDVYSIVVAGGEVHAGTYGSGVFDYHPG